MRRNTALCTKVHRAVKKKNATLYKMAKIDLFDKIYDILDIVAFSGYA